MTTGPEAEGAPSCPRCSEALEVDLVARASVAMGWCRACRVAVRCPALDRRHQVTTWSPPARHRRDIDG